MEPEPELPTESKERSRRKSETDEESDSSAREYAHCSLWELRVVMAHRDPKTGANYVFQPHAGARRGADHDCDFDEEGFKMMGPSQRPSHIDADNSRLILEHALDKVNGMLHGTDKNEQWAKDLLDERDAVSTGATARVFLNQDDDHTYWFVLVMDTAMYNQACKKYKTLTKYNFVEPDMDRVLLEDATPSGDQLPFDPKYPVATASQDMRWAYNHILRLVTQRSAIDQSCPPGHYVGHALIFYVKTAEYLEGGAVGAHILMLTDKREEPTHADGEVAQKLPTVYLREFMKPSKGLVCDDAGGALPLAH
eukprot:COSAG01_NODE_14554_length_1438_cov_4.530246_2_plen_309_part_00